MEVRLYLLAQVLGAPVSVDVFVVEVVTGLVSARAAAVWYLSRDVFPVFFVGAWSVRPAA